MQRQCKQQGRKNPKGTHYLGSTADNSSARSKVIVKVTQLVPFGSTKVLPPHGITNQALQKLKIKERLGP
jgi:hypothetical protein